MYSTAANTVFGQTSSEGQGTDTDTSCMVFPLLQKEERLMQSGVSTSTVLIRDGNNDLQLNRQNSASLAAFSNSTLVQIIHITQIQVS